MIDYHYTAGGIANEAQRYLDRGMKTDNTTEHNAIAYYNQLQPATTTRKAQGYAKATNNCKQAATSEENSRNNRTERHKAQSQAICRNYTRDFNCFHTGATAHNDSHPEPKPTSQQQKKHLLVTPIRTRREVMAHLPV